MKGFLALALVGAAILTASPALAHHSVAAIFANDRGAYLEGRLTKIDWINPHIYFYFDVPDKDGKIAKWRFESLPPAFMRRAGLTKELFMDDGGKPVRILYNPPRDPANKTGFAIEFIYADGHTYKIGNTPRTVEK